MIQTHNFGKHFTNMGVANNLESQLQETNQQDRASTIFTVEGSTSQDLMRLTQVRGESSTEYVKELNIDAVIHSPEFDWGVHKEPLSRSHDRNQKKVFSHMSLVRSDNNKELRLVQSDSPTIQNRQFFNYIRPMIEEGGYSLDSVASIDGGRSITAILKDKSAGKIEMLKNDPMEAFVLARMTRSSRPAIHINSMLFRLICANGMMNLVSDKIKVDLAKDTTMNMNSITRMLNKSSELALQVATSMKDLSEVIITPEEADQLFRKAMNLPWNDPTLEFDSDEELQNHIAEMKRNDRVISKVFSAMDEEDVLMPDEAKSSLFHWYQGLTRYVTHYRSKNANTRFREIYWGSGRKIINDGFKVAQDALNMFNSNGIVIN